MAEGAERVQGDGRACGCCCSGHRKSVAGPGLAVARPPSRPEGAPVSPGRMSHLLPAGVRSPRPGCVPLGVCPVEGDSLSSRRLKPGGLSRRSHNNMVYINPDVCLDKVLTALAQLPEPGSCVSKPLALSVHSRVLPISPRGTVQRCQVKLHKKRWICRV